MSSGISFTIYHMLYVNAFSQDVFMAFKILYALVHRFEAYAIFRLLFVQSGFVFK